MIACFILIAISVHYKKIKLIMPLMFLIWLRSLMPVFDIENIYDSYNQLERNNLMSNNILVLVTNGLIFYQTI
jgi:hypothetical protein